VGAQLKWKTAAEDSKRITRFRITFLYNVGAQLKWKTAAEDSKRITRF